MEHVIHELKSTEQIYIQDLSEVVDVSLLMVHNNRLLSVTYGIVVNLLQGYRVPLVSHVGVLPLRESDLKELFGNISEILEFHR